ncbi:MAG: DUF58 domain-containing protein [Kiritimatiellae bacterium]|nr:DUF58 domain-containing protein [Kiritimatiellia bacterium]
MPQQNMNMDLVDSAVLARLSRLAVQARVPMSGSINGIHRSATRGSSVEFAEYRKYVPGDDIKNLDWRVYARTDRFYIKEFEADTNLRCCIILDTSASMGFAGDHGSKFDYARRLAATLAYLLAHQGDAVGLLSFAEKTLTDIPPRNSASHLRHIFDTLKTIEPKGGSEIVQTLHEAAERVSQRALVVVISDLFTDPTELLDGFQHMRFRKHDLAVFHLLDPQELAFSFDRPIRFVDMESSFSMITDPSIIETDYRHAIQQYLDTVTRGCREFNVDYQRVLIDTDYEKTLASFLLQRAGKSAAGGRARS